MLPVEKGSHRHAKSLAGGDSREHQRNAEQDLPAQPIEVVGVLVVRQEPDVNWVVVFRAEGRGGGLGQGAVADWIVARQIKGGIDSEPETPPSPALGLDISPRIVALRHAPFCALQAATTSCIAEALRELKLAARGTGSCTVGDTHYIFDWMGSL